MGREGRMDGGGVGKGVNMIEVHCTKFSKNLEKEERNRVTE